MELFTLVLQLTLLRIQLLSKEMCNSGVILIPWLSAIFLRCFKGCLFSLIFYKLLATCLEVSANKLVDSVFKLACFKHFLGHKVLWFEALKQGVIFLTLCLEMPN